jgi:glutamate racemase
LIPQIKKIIPNHIRIIDSGEAVAKQTKHIIEVNNLYNTSNEVFHSFFINNPTDVIQELVGTPFKVEYMVF